jgi:hypothetical protein
MIWEFARPEPRAVYVAVQIGSRVTDEGIARLTHTLWLGTCPPAILASSFEGRTAALKIYRPILAAMLVPAGMKSPVYFGELSFLNSLTIVIRGFRAFQLPKFILRIY